MFPSTGFSASTTYTNTRHATITSTATVTSTATETSTLRVLESPSVTAPAMLRGRQVDLSGIANAIIARQLGSSASDVSADAGILASVTSALSSGCSCLRLPDPTINVTATAATLV